MTGELKNEHNTPFFYGVVHEKKTGGQGATSECGHRNPHSFLKFKHKKTEK